MQRPRPRPKFSITPVMDFRSKIKDIVDNTTCVLHKADLGIPCFHIPRDTAGYHAGICNKRILKVFNGQVSTSSLNRRNATRYPKKEFTR